MKTDEFEVLEEQEGERLDKYLSAIYPERSRSFFQKLIKEDHIRIDGSAPKASTVVKAGEIIRIDFPDAEQTAVEPEEIPLDILYEDDDVLIVNKPKGMVVHPSAGHYSGTLVNAVLFYCAHSLSGINGEIRPGIVHRIDRDTTGSLIVCKNDASHLCIAKQIKEHSVNRIYEGIVCGVVKEEEGTISGAIGRHPHDRKKMAVNEKNGKPAVTHYKVLGRFSNHTYMQFKLETGRTHQIRVHMASVGHPLLGDGVYGTAGGAGRHLEGQTLHAKTIGFIHPSSGEYVEVSAPLPEYFAHLLKTLP